MYASGYATPPPTHPPVCHNDAKCDAGGPLNPSTVLSGAQSSALWTVIEWFDNPMLHTVSVNLIQPWYEANGRHVQIRPRSSTTAARVSRTTARKQCLSTFLASRSLCAAAAAPDGGARH